MVEEFIVMLHLQLFKVLVQLLLHGESMPVEQMLQDQLLGMHLVIHLLILLLCPQLKFGTMQLQIQHFLSV